MKCFPMALLFIILSCSNVRAGNDNPDYYFDFSVSISDSLYKKDDDATSYTNKLDLQKNGAKFKSIYRRIEEDFKSIVVKNKKYYNAYGSIRDETYKKFPFKDNIAPLETFKNRDAYSRSLLRERYGENGGRIILYIKIKYSDFPVVYNISLHRSANNSLRAYEWGNDIDFCTPEGIENALVATARALMKKYSHYEEFMKE